MSTPAPVPGPVVETFPFVALHRRLQETPAAFVPSARLVVTPALRTGGLLSALPDREARALLALLTFLLPDGRLQPTAPEVASALGVSVREAQARLRHLGDVLYAGEPLVREVGRSEGLDYFALSPRALAYREEDPEEESTRFVPAAIPEGEAAFGTDGSDGSNGYRAAAAGRDAVIAHSRAVYGTPRAEAERLVLAQLGHASEEGEDTPAGAVRRRLSALGVSREQATFLLERHSLEEITDQLDWLPYRGAMNPARFIVAAITQGYAPPLAVQAEQRKHAERAERAEQARLQTESGEPPELLPEPPPFPDAEAAIALSVPPFADVISQARSEAGEAGEASGARIPEGGQDE